MTVSFIGTAASRERRVRRTVRPNKEERWQNSPEPAGYKRMSAFCTVDSINLEDAIDRLTGFSSFGERLSITSYTDVVHCRFFTKPFTATSLPERRWMALCTVEKAPLAIGPSVE